jgi:hypothetical protein
MLAPDIAEMGTAVPASGVDTVPAAADIAPAAVDTALAAVDIVPLVVDIGQRAADFVLADIDSATDSGSNTAGTGQEADIDPDLKRNPLPEWPRR